MLSAGAILAGCATPSSSAWTPRPPPPPSGRPVRVVFFEGADGAEELGVVEANGRRPLVSLDAIVAELQGRAAAVGADVVRVDGFATRYETVRQEYTYDCSTIEMRMETSAVTVVGADGTPQTSFVTMPVTETVPKTCTGWQDVEVATLALTGRAFRTNGAPP